MSTFFYFCYYRLYQWSVKRDANIPLFLTVAWLSFTLFMNVVGLCALVSIFTGIDLVSIWLIGRGNKYLGASQFLIWGLVVWAYLRVFRIHEKAFSDQMKEKYESMGCKGWWVVAYHVVSYIIMGVLVLIASLQLRGNLLIGESGQ